MSATVLEGQADCGARHGWRSRSMALRMTRSLRMAAVSASFLALPALGDREGLPVGLNLEGRRADVGHPDLDRSQALPAQPLHGALGPCRATVGSRLPCPPSTKVMCDSDTLPKGASTASYRARAVGVVSLTKVTATLAGPLSPRGGLRPRASCCCGRRRCGPRRSARRRRARAPGSSRRGRCGARGACRSRSS